MLIEVVGSGRLIPQLNSDTLNIAAHYAYITISSCRLLPYSTTILSITKRPTIISTHPHTTHTTIQNPRTQKHKTKNPYDTKPHARKI
jgi:hypothetical protein